MLGVRCEPLLNYFKRKKEDGLKTLNYNYDRHPKSLNANLALLFGHWDVCDDHHVVVVVVVSLNVLYVLLDDDYCGVGLQITVNNETLYVLITSDTDVLVRCR